MTRRALVLGATGGFGAAMALELARRGWLVRALARTTAKLEIVLGGLDRVEMTAGDALQAEPVLDAAEGCEVIVHAANLPYARWMPDMEYITSNVGRAARVNSALILFPGNVYGFGKQTGRPLPESTPMRPDTRKGAFRIQLEELLKSTTTDSDVRVLIVRAGDFFGPTVRNGLVERIFGHAVRGKPMQALGRLDVAHQWAFMPDLTRLAADLLERAGQLERVEVVHFKGHVAESQRAFLEQVARAAGPPDLEVRTLPWWLLRLMGVADPQLRELIELRYLFDEAVILDDPRRRELHPDFAPSPLEVALRDTLDSYRSQGTAAARVTARR